MSPIKIFMYVLGMIMFMLVIFITAQLFFSFRTTIDTRHMDRFATELAENLFSSPLTVSRAVFDKEKLDEYNSYKHKMFVEDTSITTNPSALAEYKILGYKPVRYVGGEEPFVRNCEYGYYLTIEDLDAKPQACSKFDDCKNFCSSTCGTDPSQVFDGLNCGCNNGCFCKNQDNEIIKTPKWEIGYKVINVPTGVSKELESLRYISKKVTNTYPVEILYPTPDKKGYDIHVGKMTVDIYDTTLSSISCLIEDAWKLKQVQKIPIPCLNLISRSTGADCYIPIRQDGNYICIFDKYGIFYKTSKEGEKIDLECRYLPSVQLEDFDTPYTPSKDAGYRTLKAIPIKESLKDDPNALSCSESGMKFASRIPKEAESVGKIILCVGV